MCSPTGISSVAIELKKCITTDLCKDTVTAYMGFPVTNKSVICKSAFRNGARATAPTPIFLVLFLKTLFQ